MRRKPVFPTLTAILLATGIIALAGVTTAAAQKLRIGFHRRIYGSIDVVAWKKGYFNRTLGKGNYSINSFAQGKLMMEALLSNSLDVGHATDRAFVGVVGKGAKIIGLAVHVTSCATMHVMVDARSNINSIKQIKGKNLAAKKGSGGYYAFRRFVAPGSGLTEKDWTLVNTRATERLSALRAGTVQVSILNEPAASVAVQKGLARSLTNFCKWSEIPWVVVANPRTLKRSPKQFVQYMRAWKMASDFKNKNPDEFARIYHDYLRSKGKKGSLETVKIGVSTLGTGRPFDKEFYTHMVKLSRFLKLDGKVKRIPDFEGGEGVDTSVLEKALRAN